MQMVDFVNTRMENLSVFARWATVDRLAIKVILDGAFYQRE